MAHDGYFAPDERFWKHAFDASKERDSCNLDAYRLGSIESSGRSKPGAYVRHDSNERAQCADGLNSSRAEKQPDYSPKPGDKLFTAAGQGRVVIYSRDLDKGGEYDLANEPFYL